MSRRHLQVTDLAPANHALAVVQFKRSGERARYFVKHVVRVGDDLVPLPGMVTSGLVTKREAEQRASACRVGGLWAEEFVSSDLGEGWRTYTGRLVPA